MSLLKISPSNKNVVYVHSNAFKNMKNLTNHVVKLHKDHCGGTTNLCQQKPCNSTLVLYIDKKYQNLSLKSIETTYYKYISAFLSIEIYKEYVEIYNVCTSKFARKRGIMRSIFKSVTKDIPKSASNKTRKIWIGVAIDNKMLTPVIKLYLSVGFKAEGIQSISPSGIFPNFPFLSMIYVGNDNISDLSDIQKMIKNYVKNKGKCKITVHIEPELMENINTYISSDVEHGGIMGAKSVGNNKFILGIAAVTKGSKNNFTVNTPRYFITWHTHPFICYKNNLCYIGWPSGQDMGSILPRYMEGQIAHILFSNEGTYVLQLSRPMMEFMRAMTSECVDYLSKLVSYYFENLEHFRKAEYDPERSRCLDKLDDIRCLTYNTKQKQLSIKKIINVINTYTLTNLLNLGDNNNINRLVKNVNICLIKAGKNIKGNSNIPIFKVNYTDGNKSLRDGVTATIEYLIAPKNSVCPIPEYKSKDIDYGDVMMDID